MSRSILVLSIALLIAGCASNLAQSKIDPFGWTGKCRDAGCVERSNVVSDAPLGAELSFSRCADEVTQFFMYRRESRGWVLTSYRADALGRCASEP